VNRVGGHRVEDVYDVPELVVLADVELARLRETASNHLLDQCDGLFAGFVRREIVPVDALLDDEHRAEVYARRTSRLTAVTAARRSSGCAPDIDVARPLLFRERDPDQAVGIVELEPADKGGGSFGDPHCLLVLEPMADASAEELGDARQLRLVPTELGLEITSARSLVLERR
jgi:hypothetical protein